ncbi:MAG: hypothetical protein JXR63_04940 [Spirochaetales bacterium]|nr:hypothetical protein [Spirochaetales bacterium]
MREKMKLFFQILSILCLLVGCDGDLTEGSKGKLSIDSSSYSSGDSVILQLKDVNVDHSETISVKVVSESDKDGITVVLTWDAESSAFTGSFSFSGVLSDSSLYISGNEKFSVIYRDSDSQEELIIEGSVLYVVEELFATGTITLDSEVYPVGGRVVVEVVDSDLTADSISVSASVQGSSSAISVVLSWDSENKSYVGSFLLSASSGGENSLECEESDIIEVVYNDAAPAASRKTVATVATAGTICIVQSKVDPGASLDIYVEDEDLDSSDVVSVLVTSVADPVGIELPLSWNTVSSRFDGVVETSLVSSSGKILVGYGDTVVASYSDSSPAVVVSDSCGFYNLAELEFLDSNINVNETVSIRLIDADLSAASTPVVHVISSSDSSGINVSLSYNSSSQDFRGSFGCSDEVVSGELFVEGGDLVTASYTDYNPVQLVSISSNVVHVGELSFDGLEQGKKYAPGEEAKIFLKDYDLPIDSAPQVVVESSDDSITLNLSWNSSEERFEASFYPVLEDADDLDEILVDYGDGLRASYQDLLPADEVEALAMIYAKGIISIYREKTDGSWLPVDEIVIDGTQYRVRYYDVDLSGAYSGEIVQAIVLADDAPLRDPLPLSLDSSGYAYFTPVNSDQPMQDELECYWQEIVQFFYYDEDLEEPVFKELPVVYNGELKVNKPTLEYRIGDNFQIYLVDKDLDPDDISYVDVEFILVSDPSVVISVRLNWNSSARRYESQEAMLVPILTGPGEFPVTVGESYIIRYTDLEYYDGEGYNGVVDIEIVIKE